MNRKKTVFCTVQYFEEYILGSLNCLNFKIYWNDWLVIGKSDSIYVLAFIDARMLHRIVVNSDIRCLCCLAWSFAWHVGEISIDYILNASYIAEHVCILLFLLQNWLIVPLLLIYSVSSRSYRKPYPESWG